jgi:oxygen-independent coproporphyrinogen-3 oxidase
MIYFHIPFCKQACHYCNFHFSTSLRHRDVMTDALLKELKMRSGYLEGEPVSSIYFGGGTPSLLPVKDIERIIAAIFKDFEVLPGAEITLEANPDDLSTEWLNDLRNYTPVNRLSIGIQSFHDADLEWMNRAHNAGHARKSLAMAQKAGFEDLTIDLIYGSPTTSDEQWAENLYIAFDHGIPHLSCYCLTVEEGTALHHFVQKGKSLPVDEERAARQFEYLMDQSAKAGYEQYEISNFAFPGRHARHNSNYWLGTNYLGIGPAAHSFNGVSRQWNVANNARYINGVEEGQLVFEQEQLTPDQRFNEYVMTMLRTHWGCRMERLKELHEAGAAVFEQQASSYISKGEMELQEGAYRLTPQGRLLADRIAMELFVG